MAVTVQVAESVAIRSGCMPDGDHVSFAKQIRRRLGSTEFASADLPESQSRTHDLVRPRARALPGWTNGGDAFCFDRVVFSSLLSVQASAEGDHVPVARGLQAWDGPRQDDRLQHASYSGDQCGRIA
jgi:hypothetical protein